MLRNSICDLMSVDEFNLENMWSGECRRRTKREPTDGVCFPSWPFPVLPVRYPGAAADLFDQAHPLFNGTEGRFHLPPPNQSAFTVPQLKRAACGFLVDPHVGPRKDLPRGFYFDNARDVLGYDDEGLVKRMKFRSHFVMSLVWLRIRNVFSSLIGGDIARDRSFSDYSGFNSKVNYARFMSRQSYTIDLFRALSVVCLKSFDMMTVMQLITSLWLDRTFVQMRDEQLWVIALLTIMVLQGTAIWVYFAYRQTLVQVSSDIDYVGDLVWVNNNDGDKPADGRVASNFQVRISLFFMNLFELPYHVREVVNLCHPRKGAMKFGAFGGWGRLPRICALGYENKTMFEYEESAGTFATVPHIVFSKLPTVFIKLYILFVYQRTFILGMSIMLASGVILMKLAVIIEYMFKASTFMNWMVENHEEGGEEQRIIIEKKLKKDFYFSVDDNGQLVNPGTMGWLKQMRPAEVNRTHDSRGFMAKYGNPSLRSKERVCISSGGERIPEACIELLRLADDATGQVRTEFWYRISDRAVEYSDPGDGDVTSGFDAGWRYGRLITLSSFVQELSFSLVKGSLNSMYAVGMLNLCAFLFRKASEEEDKIVGSVFLVVFLFTRVLWLVSALWQTQSSIVIDWKEVGDFVTDLGATSRMEMFISTMVVHMFAMPKQIREAVSLFHPEKGYQPYSAFGGRNFGPRAFAIGFATKDMFETETYHGALSQVPLVFADCVICVGLCRAFALEFHPGRMEALGFDPEARARRSYRIVNVVMLILTCLTCQAMRISSLYRYFAARYRYRAWLMARMNSEVTESELNALRKQWRIHFA